VQADIPSHLLALYEKKHSRHGAGGWRAVGDYFGISGTYAREIALKLKPVTIEVAEAWLIATGQARVTLPVVVCPDCGMVHDAERCHNRPIAAVVILHPGEQVTQAPGPQRVRKTPRKAVSMSQGLWEDLDSIRRKEGITWEHLLERLR